MVAVWGYVQRNYFLTKRYFMWEVVWLVYVTINAMAITFIGAGAESFRWDEPGYEVRYMTYPARGRSAVELPLDALRRALRDGELGAVGGDHRVHVHEPHPAGLRICSAWVSMPSSTASCRRC